MSTSPASPPTVPDQATLIDWGVEFLSAILDSADVEKIGPKQWWDRARTALETGTATAAFSEAVSKTAAKLEIDGALSARSSATINRLAEHLSDPAVFGAWAELCTRDAVYITALTRMRRDEAKASAKAAKRTPADSEEIGF